MSKENMSISAQPLKCARVELRKGHEVLLAPDAEKDVLITVEGRLPCELGGDFCRVETVTGSVRGEQIDGRVSSCHERFGATAVEYLKPTARNYDA